jgi:hypothetical protein
MTNLLKQNSKMKNASIVTYNFNIPAVETCPNAGQCKQVLDGTKSSYCFAKNEEVRYPSVRKSRQLAYKATKSADFVQNMTAEITKLVVKNKGKQIAIRIHASGDFYSAEYLTRWIDIANSNTTVVFYAYTKSHALVLRLAGKIPSNLIVIHSLGSNIDSLVHGNLRHARIFNSEQDALDAGYVLANEDDSVAWSSSNHKIGLVIFGSLEKRFKSSDLQNKMKIA